MTRLTLVRHGATTATRRAAFPAGEEPLEPAAIALARALAPRIGRWEAAWRGPERCAAETASALGLKSEPVPALADLDAGAWRGLTVAELARAEPAALAKWTIDPCARPPGGESVRDALARVSGWLSERAGDDARIVAVTSAIVIRAAVTLALAAPPESVWRIDVAPLSRTVLHARGGRWTVRALNVSAAEEEDLRRRADRE